MDAPQLGSQEQANQLIEKIMEKSWADESFKKKLLADATATLIAEGVAIPEGIKVNVVENTGNVLNFVLPANPAAELSDTDLEMVAGGKGMGNWHGQMMGETTGGGPIDLGKYL